MAGQEGKEDEQIMLFAIMGKQYSDGSVEPLSDEELKKIEGKTAVLAQKTIPLYFGSTQFAVAVSVSFTEPIETVTEKDKIDGTIVHLHGKEVLLTPRELLILTALYQLRGKEKGMPIESFFLQNAMQRSLSGVKDWNTRKRILIELIDKVNAAAYSESPVAQVVGSTIIVNGTQRDLCAGYTESEFARDRFAHQINMRLLSSLARAGIFTIDDYALADKRALLDKKLIGGNTLAFADRLFMRYYDTNGRPEGWESRLRGIIEGEEIPDIPDAIDLIEAMNTPLSLSQAQDVIHDLIRVYTDCVAKTYRDAISSAPAEEVGKTREYENIVTELQAALGTGREEEIWQRILSARREERGGENFYLETQKRYKQLQEQNRLP